jgi:hypothetical protein
MMEEDESDIDSSQLNWESFAANTLKIILFDFWFKKE